MGKKKAEGTVVTSSSGKPSDGAYKREMRWEKNKKLRAKRHETRMIDQMLRVNKRYDEGKPLPSKTVRKIEFNRSVSRNY